MFAAAAVLAEAPEAARPLPDVPMAGAPIADERRPVAEHCDQCGHVLDEHREYDLGVVDIAAPARARVVLWCVVCQGVCRRL